MPRKRTTPFLPDDFDDMHDGFEKFDEQLKIISQCPVCDTKFSAKRSQILEDRGEEHLIYLHCQKCLNSVVAVIRFGAQGITSVGMVTDLSYDDVLRLKDAPPVQIDDVLDLHEALQKLDWHVTLTNT